MDSKNLISKIACLRERAAMTQLELSRRVGVTETTIANWEKGRSGLDWIERVIRLCEVLSCSPKDLLEYRIPNSVEPVPALSQLHKDLGVDQITHSANSPTTSMSAEQADLTDCQEVPLPG